jgi:methyl-accepting chemotaxis protein
MKLFNSLRFRFISLFALFIIVLCSVMGISAVTDSMKTAMRLLAMEGSSITEKAAHVIDGDAFENLARTLDQKDPFYEETRLSLFAIKSESNCRYLFTMAPRGNTYIYIIDGSVPPDHTDFSALGDKQDTSHDDAFKRSWELKTTQVSELQYQEGFGRLVSIYTPIFNSQGTMVGIVGCDFDADDLYHEIQTQAMHQIVVASVFLLAGLGIMIMFMRMIFRRINTISRILREISEGEGDLTRRIKILHQDEIGELGIYFNSTLEKIKCLIISIKDRSSALFETGKQLSQNMEQTASAINHINLNIDSIKGQVANQSTSVAETNATMNQVTTDINQLNGHVEMQTASVSQSSSAIEEMLANIQSVTHTLVQNAENVNELSAVSEIGRAGLEEVSRDIQAIARESEGLLEINTVMENIASQTNLLSMNAAIEAAHAGEAGKGFAVVAAEIRKLAENSSAQSKTISDVLKKIKTSIDKITKSTATVLDKFQAIDSRIKTVSQQEENIRNAMEEQGHGSKQILEAIGTLNELTQQVKKGSVKMLAGSKEVIQESKRLDEVTRQLSGGMTEMASSSNHINSAVKSVNDISFQNKDHIDALVSEVSKFKVE